MNFKRSATVAAIMVMATVTLKSQAQDTLRVNMAQAIDIALSDNPTIMVANKEIERQMYVKRETRGALMPNLSASGSYNYNIMNPVMFMPEGVFGPGSGGALRLGFSNSLAGGFSLSLPLYIPTVYKTLQLNDQQLRAAVEAARGSKITLVNQVKNSYYGILLAENSLQVIKDNIEFARVVVNTTQNSYNQGLSSEYDLITAQVQLSNLTPTLIQVENSIRVGRLMLNMLLSLPLDTQLAPEEQLNDFKEYIDGAELNAVNLSQNSDLLQLDVQKDILGKQLELQKATRIPTISAVAQYQVQTQSNNMKIGSFDWRGTALAGLQLSVPIFAGLSRTSKEQQIKNSIEQLKMQRDYMEESVNVQAQTELSNIIKANEQMIANSAARTQAQKGYRIAKTRYDTGAGTIVELNSAQMALMQADLNYSQSIYDYMSAQANFDKIIGKIN